MQFPVSIDLEQIAWTPHPTIAGIQIKVFQNAADVRPTDVMVARVDAQGEIPWHVHATDMEIAYVLRGKGILHYTASQEREQVSQAPMNPGSAVIVPPGIWHSVKSSGEEDMLIFCTHTP
jgi:quercetin dioxygenase-like cupin family protein